MRAGAHRSRGLRPQVYEDAILRGRPAEARAYHTHVSYCRYRLDDARVVVKGEC